MRFSAEPAALLVALVLAAPARADVQVYDTATGAVTTPVSGEAQLLGWTDDGAALLLKRAHVVRSDGVELPNLDAADSIGPGGRWLEFGPPLKLHAADGRVVATRDFGLLFLEFHSAWSRDGTRVAVATRDELFVFDTTSGALLVHRSGREDRLTEQAFAPDNSALVVGEGSRILLLALPSGAARALTRVAHDLPEAAWSSAGRIAVTSKHGIGVLGLPSIRFKYDSFDPALWSGDGTTLRYTILSDDCFGGDGVGLAAPGAGRRVLVRPSGRELQSAIWAPAGARLAVARGPAPAPERRGKRHPWPKSIPHDYTMFSRRGNAAMRRIVVRAARMLRRGASREETLARVRVDFQKADARYREASDTQVRNALADQIDRWLRAAGFARIDALDEITC